MQQDACGDESFYSFLAGALLKKRKVSDKELVYLCSDFERKYKTYIFSGFEEEWKKLYTLIYEDASGIGLGFDYDYYIKKYKMTAQECLYSLTSPKVREFFNIEEKNVKKPFSKVRSLFGLRLPAVYK